MTRTPFLFASFLVVCVAVDQINFKDVFTHHLDKHADKLNAAGVDTEKIKNVTGLIAEEASEAFDMFVEIFRTEGENGERIYNKLDAEWAKRKQNFVDLFQMIAKNNIEGSNFKMAINQFADFSSADAGSMKGISDDAQNIASATEEQLCQSVPTTCKDKRRRLVAERFETALDWSTSNNPGGRPVVTGVVNQGSCNNCWACAATEVMESRYALDQGTDPPNLAIAQITDCWAHNCEPGNPMNAYKYAESTGLTVESSFPLDTVDGRAHSCHAFDPVIKNTESHYMSLNGNEQLLKDIIKQGPTVLAINAFHPSRKLMMYKSGIFDQRSGCTVGALDHAVVGVGYGEENGIKYWKIRNSWGKKWGENGYFRIRRSPQDADMNGLCGIVTGAYISTRVEKNPAAPLGSLQAGMPKPCLVDLSITDSRATCAMMGCSASRNAVCENRKCVCKPDHCSNQNPLETACRPRNRMDGPVVVAPAKKSFFSFGLNEDGSLEENSNLNHVPESQAYLGGASEVHFRTSTTASLAVAAVGGVMVGGVAVASVFVLMARKRIQADTPASISATTETFATL